MQQLQRLFGEEDGMMLHDMAHGRDSDVVQARSAAKSIGCGKSFTAHLQLKTVAKVRTENVPAAPSLPMDSAIYDCM